MTAITFSNTLLGPIKSTYWWKGKIERAEEW
ncbi:MAG TPA: divalent cation tolerance protein CutA, partial [Desulfobacterales bacterium]|nr:divalent cation tolerance protein CutA [Desulfobacterales bacterium]